MLLQVHVKIFTAAFHNINHLWSLKKVTVGDLTFEWSSIKSGAKFRNFQALNNEAQIIMCGVVAMILTDVHTVPLSMLKS